MNSSQMQTRKKMVAGGQPAAFGVANIKCIELHFLLTSMGEGGGSSQCGRGEAAGKVEVAADAGYEALRQRLRLRRRLRLPARAEVAACGHDAAGRWLLCGSNSLCYVCVYGCVCVLCVWVCPRQMLLVCLLFVLQFIF